MTLIMKNNEAKYFGKINLNWSSSIQEMFKKKWKIEMGYEKRTCTIISLWP